MSTNFAKETISISLEEEMRRSYLDYAMSVIVGRALPDVRDGLKPVHRRVLFAMHELNNDYNKAYKKSARIVGDVIGKYHPHGDTAVYDAIVRLAQSFSLRYPLIDGQGNFGSVDGDAAAAMRYTEVRLSKIAHQLLENLDQDTVDFTLNYDASEKEPSILPANLPNLLINGSSGIAVGMATNIPPHNINEVIKACLLLLRNSECSIEELIECIPAPDFPTGALIYGISGAKDAYRTGKGRVVMRARIHIEDMDKGNRQAIIIDELPYQVNKRTLLEKIAELINEKRIEGISDIRDESDQSGMRVVLELKKGVISEVVVNHLYKNTQLQDSFSINMVALANGQPQLLNLKQILQYFLSHRREIITRRTKFELKKALERSHILEGLAVALANIDEFITIIKTSNTPNLAKQSLIIKSWASALVQTMLASKLENTKIIGLQKDGRYILSEIQTEQILQMRLQRLTAIEQDKIIEEYQQIMLKIHDLEDILNNPQRVTDMIANDLEQLMSNFGDTRRSEIILNTNEINIEDLIIPQDMVVTLSNTGYIKSQPLSEYKVQRRGGRGKQATTTKEDDWVTTLLSAHSHDYILCFSDKGRLHWLKVYAIPQGARTSRGKPINNVLNLQPDEKITAILSTKHFTEDRFVTMTTSKAVVKRCTLAEFSNPRRMGINAINLDDGDYLIGVEITDGSHDIMLFNSNGKASRFNEQEVRCVGRNARGVRGMRLDESQTIVAMLVVPNAECIEESGQSFVLTATENGYGKLTHVNAYSKHHRGSMGVIAISTSSRNGKMVAATLVSKQDDVMFITNSGVMVRTNVAQIRTTGRSAQGVTLINLDEQTKLSVVQRIAEKDDDIESLDEDLTI